MNIDDALLVEARELAARSRRSLGDIELPVFGGSGLRAGVDLDDKDALAKLLDEDRDTRAAG